MVGSVQFRIRGVKRVTAKFTQLRNDVRGINANEVIEKGWRLAKKIAPRDTNAMINTLQKIKKKRSAKLVLNKPKNRDGRQRPYHIWMHGIGKYNTSHQHFKGKDPKFMFTTAQFMKLEIRKLAKNALKKKR